MKQRFGTKASVLVIGILFSTISIAVGDQIELDEDSVIGGTGSWAGDNDWDLGQFRAQLVTDNQFEDEIDEQEQSPDDDTGGFWLGKEGDEEEAFVLDLQQEYTIDEIHLYNTHNATFDDRATFGYEIWGSNEIAPFDTGEMGEGGNDLANARLMAEGELELVFFEDDPLLAQLATITDSGPFRYIRFNTVGPFHEDDVVLPQRSVGINEIKVFGTLGGGVPFDLNGDGTLDISDLNLLIEEVKAATNGAQFDVNGDGLVNGADITDFVTSPDKLNTFIGDSNLDGEFNSSDFVGVFTSGKFETGTSATWAEGDWDGDGKFDSSDFVAAFTDGGFEIGPRETANVPEPIGVGVILIAIGCCWRHRRRR